MLGMKLIVSGVTLLAIGIFLGWYSSWVYSYYPSKEDNDLYIELEEIFKFSGLEIGGDNYSCEGNGNRTVGAVLGSIFQSNMNMPRNGVSMLCHENKCGLIYNYCKPWQSQECGSKILRFDLRENKKIIPESFVCLDVP